MGGDGWGGQEADELYARDLKRGALALRDFSTKFWIFLGGSII